MKRNEKPGGSAEVTYYTSVWERSELPAGASALPTYGNILVFGGTPGLWRMLREQLAAAGGSGRLTVVMPGTDFRELVDGGYAINPSEPADYLRCLTALSEKGWKPDRLLHAWGTEPDAPAVQPAGPAGEAFAEPAGSQERMLRGMYAVFHWIRAAAQLKLKSLVRYVAMYQGGDPFGEALAGYCKSLQPVLPGMQFSAVGVDGDEERICRAALAEMAAKLPANQLDVRYDGGHRLVARHRAVRPDLPVPPLCKQGGTYLITGGAGGLGFLFARHLAQEYRANLVLVGRSELDAARTAQLDEIRRLGGEPLYLRADVCSLPEMTGVIQTVRERFGALNGVLHAAGRSGETMILKNDLAGFAATLAPKVNGALVLDAVTRQEALDFFVLFSSIASIFGDYGSCDYAIANRFLDSFARLREGLRAAGARHGKTLAVNWPLWREGGMHIKEASAQGEETFLRSAGMVYLESAVGLAAFEALLGAPQAQAAVLCGDRARMERMLDMASLKEAEPAAAPVALAAPAAPPAPAARPAPVANQSLESLVQSDLQRLAAGVIMLSPSELDPQANFGEYGFDSNGIKALGRKVGHMYGIELLPQVFFSNSTIRSLAGYLLAEYGNQLRTHYAVHPAAVGAVASVEAAGPKGRTLEPLAAKLRSGAPAARPVGQREPVAVVGMSGIFPGAPDVQRFWEALDAMTNLISEVPPDRWDWHNHYGPDADPAQRHASKWGGFIADADKFDAPFFSISRREAELMDPQQRLFLQSAWTAIEDAGYKVSELSGRRIAVFVGAEFNDYQQLLYERLGVSHPLTATGNAHTVLSNRISYLFNFRGPSGAFDTACSSSLVAVHRAVQSIQNGESEMALAGGVSLQLLHQTFTAVSLLGVMAPDGKCKTFDESANGYARSEGVGVVLLKPLSRAVTDGDHIYGVIRASAEGHGGRASSLTAPNAEAQAELLVRAYDEARIDPATVTYMECHGTGTELGDPVEIDGLTRTFKELYRRAGYAWPPTGKHCGLSSVKANVGHLEPAAGITGLIKLLLCLQHKRLPGTLHLQRQNPYIDLRETPFYIVRESMDWPRLSADDGRALPLRAGVSSFGFGGSYAHVVLEEYLPPARSSAGAAEPQLIILSARNRERLQEYARTLADYVGRHADEPDFDLQAVAYTLQVGREELDERLAVVVSDPAELAAVLADYALGKEPGAAVATGTVKKGKAGVELLMDGAEGQQFVRALLQEGKLAKLAQLWVRGISVDWRLLHQGALPGRVSLPTYPFARESYWIPDDAPAPARAKPAVAAPAVAAPAVAAPDVAAPAAAGQPEPVALAPALPPEVVLQEEVRRIAAAVVKMAPAEVDPDGALGDYGFDSISAKEFADNLSQALGVEVFPTVIFAHGTIRTLTGYLLTEYGDRLTLPAAPAPAAAAVEPTPAQQASDQAPDQALAQAAVSLALEQVGVAAAATEAPQTHEPIAIIGVSGMFPRSRNLDEFWHHLERGDDLITEIPPDRWDWRSYYGDHVSGKDKSNSKWGGFVPDVDKFDAQFFSISPVEAEMMDPQQRIFLESAWKAIESAGYRPSSLSGRQVGVYLGVQFCDYEDLLTAVGETLPQMSTGTSQSIHSNRVSYLLNLNGPSESIDTACSSSLVAIHHAVRSLRSGECELAIAGGVTLMLSVRSFLGAAKLGVLSPDGRCATFDRRANGYVKGEGVGAVFLKPLSRAIRDGDHIFAVIRGTAQGHGGKAHSLTAPNAEAQAKLLVRAYEDAGIDPATVSYIEAHGTGTELGDPVETEGLKKAFRELYSKSGHAWPPPAPHCALGSVKTNIGHLEPAAGIAGVAKVILAMQHKKLPANVHLQELNPYIDLKESPFYVLRGTQPWQQPRDEQGNPVPLRAGVSSFGFGGAYAHVVLEEYDPAPAAPSTGGPQVIVLSARTEERLQAYAVDLAAFLAPAPGRAPTQVQEELQRLAGAVLGIDPRQIDPAEPLSEYGMDALSARRFVQQVSERFGLPALSPVADADSIAAYAASLAGPGQAPAPAEADGPEYTLGNIAYTLQLGREALECRLAFVAATRAELVDGLRAYLRGERPAGLFQGACDIPAGRAAKAGARRSNIPADGDLTSWARAWVTGEELPFADLHAGHERRRVVLPTYPFARNRYWVPERKSPIPAAERRERLHPLLDANVSTLREQRFTVALTGTEELLRDHQVQGRVILPGVAAVEMARAAGELSMEAPVLRMQQIVWQRPVVLPGAPDGPVKLYVTLFPDGQHVGYRIYPEDGHVCSEGQILGGDPAQPLPRLDVAAIRSRCARVVPGDHCYQRFVEAGLQYGPGFRVLRELCVGQSEALSVLALPAHLEAGAERFVLHPALFDGALHTVLGLLADAAGQADAGYVPYAIGQLEIYHPLTGARYAFAQPASRPGQGDLRKFDLMIADSEGEVLVALRDFAIRALPRPGAAPARPASMAELLQMLERGQLTAEEADQWMEGLYGEE